MSARPLHVETTTLADAKGAQITGAAAELTADYSDRPTLGYADAVRCTGPMLPGELWTVLARPENGKTTFLLNVGARWLSRGTGFAYFGTEEMPETAFRRFAAIRCGLNPGHVVANDWHLLGHDARDQVARELGRLRAAPVYFAPDTRPTLGDVRRAALETVRHGLPILVLDHFHRMSVPESANRTASLEETMRRIKQLATETGLVFLMAAQVHRTGDPLQKFHPPTQDGGKGTAAIEEESNVMLGLYRPLKRGLERGDLERFRTGEIEEAVIAEKHTMAVRVLKHRRNGDLSGRTALLHCEGGLVGDRLALP